MLDRTPPEGSLAAEILGSQSPRPDLLKTKAMIQELADQLSDFGSCIESDVASCSSGGEDSLEENPEKGGYQSMNERKRNRRRKRKLKLTPGKEEFLKRPNLVGSN